MPSCWERPGFGAHSYGRDYETYGKNFRFADEQDKYRHAFLVPATWQNQVVSIVVEGAITDAEGRVNSRLAGPVHQGAFYRFKLDLSPLLKFGQSNLLAVTLSKLAADASVNNAERLADYRVFGGILRPVYRIAGGHGGQGRNYRRRRPGRGHGPGGRRSRRTRAAARQLLVSGRHPAHRYQARPQPRHNPKNLGPLSEADHLGGPARRTLYFFCGISKTTGKPQPYVVPAKNVFFTILMGCSIAALPQ